jgi:hypothetical protein
MNYTTFSMSWLLFPCIAHTEKYTTWKYLLVNITLQEDSFWWMGNLWANRGEKSNTLSLLALATLLPQEEQYIHRYQIFEEKYHLQLALNVKVFKVNNLKVSTKLKMTII